MENLYRDGLAECREVMFGLENCYLEESLRKSVGMQEGTRQVRVSCPIWGVPFRSSCPVEEVTPTRCSSPNEPLGAVDFEIRVRMRVLSSAGNV